MKLLLLIYPVIFLCCIIACANNNRTGTPVATIIKDSTASPSVLAHDSFEPGKTIPHISCIADATQSYALYIPVKGNKETLPVVYFFDPHGNGAFPLNKYKALADQYGFILIGSNNSKNGNDGSTAEMIWNTLSADTKNRLLINTNRIYVCGFSGGARVACQLGLTHPEVKGIIANSAGMSDASSTGNFQFSFTGIAGEGDMNMTELVTTNNDLDKTQTRHRILLFDGKHEWAPESTMNIAFAGLQLDAIHDKIIPAADSAFINNYIAGSKERINNYSKANNYIKAEAECQLSINLLDGSGKAADWFKEKNASLKNNPIFQKQAKEKQDLLAIEQSRKEYYQQQFQQGDMNYWNKTINDLQARSKSKTLESGMYQRLLAYLSLAFYSISNQLITGHRDKEAQYFVELYKMADATNSEAWYFSALLNARNNNASAATDDLVKAVANGFADKDRMLQQPEFQSLGTQINLSFIAGKMK